MGFYTVQHENRQLRRDGKNALIASQNQATNLRNQGEVKISQALQDMHSARRDGKKAISAQAAQFGFSGVASTGSSQKVETSLATQLEHNINLHANKVINEVNQINYQADMEEWQGRNIYRQLRSKRVNNWTNLGSKVQDSLLPIPSLYNPNLNLI